MPQGQLRNAEITAKLSPRAQTGATNVAVAAATSTFRRATKLNRYECLNNRDPICTPRPEENNSLKKLRTSKYVLKLQPETHFATTTEQLCKAQMQRMDLKTAHSGIPRSPNHALAAARSKFLHGPICDGRRTSQTKKNAMFDFIYKTPEIIEKVHVPNGTLSPPPFRKCR